MTSTPPLQLRPATIADVALLADMHTRSRTATYRGLLPDDYIDRTMPAGAVPMWERKMPALLGGAGQALVATMGGHAIGFVCMLAPDADGSVYIDNLHALPGHQGHGVGTRLLEAAAQWARERGARRMHLRVLESNAGAIGFYESRGWVLADRVHDTWGDDVPITARVYALGLGA